MRCMAAATLVFILSISLFTATVGAQDISRTHILLKSDDTLSPEVDPDAEASRRTVNAEYVQVPASRLMREWVDIGAWKVTLDASITFSGIGGQVLLWYSEVDEGYDNDPSFRATLRIDGQKVLRDQYNHSTTDPETEPTMISIPFDVGSLQVGKGQEIELYLEYQGWEDMVLYYDSATNASGWIVGSNALLPMAVTGGRNDITLTFIDLFAIDWRTVAEYVYVYAAPVDDPRGPIDPAYRLQPFTVQKSDPVPVGNGTAPMTMLRFDVDLDDGTYQFGARFQYNPLSDLHNLSFERSFSSGGGKGLGDDPVAGGSVLGGAMIAALFIAGHRRRGRRPD